MVTSACEILIDEPQRFLDYIFSDPNLRSQIVDKKSFIEALEKTLKSDPSLTNIAETIKKAGESFEVCGQNIFLQNSIQNLIKDNVDKRRDKIEKRVKKERPKLRGKKLEAEIERRLKISIATQSRKVKQTKQVTIDQALKPIKVGDYRRGGQTIKSYRKTKYRNLNTQEKMLIENAIKKNKNPQEVVRLFRESGLPFRTKTSIKRHYYRQKKKI